LGFAVGDRLLFPGSSSERVDLSQANQIRRKFCAIGGPHPG